MLCLLLVTFVLILRHTSIQATTDLTGHDSQPNAQRTEIAVFAQFRSPVASLVVPSPTNDTWLHAGYFAFLLEMLCERLHLRPNIAIGTDLSTVMNLNNGFERFREIQSRFTRLYANGNLIQSFNER